MQEYDKSKWGSGIKNCDETWFPFLTVMPFLVIRVFNADFFPCSLLQTIYSNDVWEPKPLNCFWTYVNFHFFILSFVHFIVSVSFIASIYEFDAKMGFKWPTIVKLLSCLTIQYIFTIAQKNFVFVSIQIWNGFSW